MGLPQNTTWLHRKLKSGPRNTIADVDGVLVGHSTIHDGDIHSGVSVLLPGKGLPEQTYRAACHVINGYSKPIGLIQVQELGCLESPICLTNTLAIGTVADRLTRIMIRRASENLYSFNPLVLECNDGYLSDMKSFPVRANHVDEAFSDLRPDFAEGAYGAGSGMVCYGFKGGIGSASRLLDGGYTLGALVLTNFGQAEELIVAEHNIAAEITSPDKGSVIVIVATDAPLDARQLARLSRRVQSGLARTGSSLNHGSGEIALVFSTSHSACSVAEDELNGYFAAVVESVQEAVLSSLFHAKGLQGFQGHRVRGLQALLRD